VFNATHIQFGIDTIFPIKMLPTIHASIRLFCSVNQPFRMSVS